MKLYIVYDEDRSYQFVVRANSHGDAMNRFQDWVNTIEKDRYFFKSIRWYVDRADNSTVIE